MAESVSTRTSPSTLSDLAALASQTEHRIPESEGAKTERHSIISEAQGAFQKYANARAKELDPTGDTITEKDVIEKTVPTEGKVDVLTIETKLMREVEARVDDHKATSEPIPKHSPTALVQAACQHILKLREAETSGRANFIGDERGF